MSARLPILCFTLYFIGFFTVPALAETAQVANYSVGKYGTKSYEHFSFWVKSDKREAIEYSYGKEGKYQKITYLDSSPYRGKRAFRLKFDDGLILHAVPQGSALLLTDVNGKYRKVFKWEYEGPVDGRGTFCSECAQDDKTAMNLLEKYFISPILE